MAQARSAWAINQWEKTSIHNLQYGPRKQSNIYKVNKEKESKVNYIIYEVPSVENKFPERKSPKEKKKRPGKRALTARGLRVNTRDQGLVQH